MARKSRKASPKTPAVAADGEAGVAVQAPPKGGGGRGKGKFARRMATTSYKAGAGKDKHLVIVESPSKAKTINKYLGKEYLVLASVGHVRDSAPDATLKGVKNPVPGVDLEKDFKPTYEISEGKERVIADLKRAAKEALGSGHEVWFATDLDREGEAIAWHLAQEPGRHQVKPSQAGGLPRHHEGRNRKSLPGSPTQSTRTGVNAQQARAHPRPHAWATRFRPCSGKKVARGLSAGRVQSVAVRLVVDREREIRAFIPDEYWEISANFTAELCQGRGAHGRLDQAALQER